MRFVKAVIKEKRSVLILVNKCFSFFKEIESHFFIVPDSGFAAFHPTYTWNPVNHTSLMTVCPFHSHKLRIAYRVRLSGETLFIININRISRIESYNISIFNIHGRYSVHCGRNNICKVKTYCICRGFDMVVPVCLATSHSQMPFTDSCRDVA